MVLTFDLSQCFIVKFLFLFSFVLFSFWEGWIQSFHRWWYLCCFWGGRYLIQCGDKGKEGSLFKAGKKRTMTNFQAIISCCSIRVGFVSELKAQSSFSAWTCYWSHPYNPWIKSYVLVLNTFSASFVVYLFRSSQSINALGFQGLSSSDRGSYIRDHLGNIEEDAKVSPIHQFYS